MNVQTYLEILNTRYKTGISREHTYRGDLQNLLMALLPDVLVTNEPSRVACGAPDYVLTKKDIPVGYIEAKDIGVDLHSKTLKEQFDRYKKGLNNLIFTDYLDFHFYKNGEFTTSITIAKIEKGSIVSMPENFDQFQSLIENFAQTVSQSIKSPTKLAEMMAGKAKLMANVIEQSLAKDDETDHKSALKSQMLSFKQMLIHDIDNQAFADIYSQTIAYGMFAARYHDPTLPTFSRQEAATLIPKSNPFLRKLFQDIAGYDLDDRLVWIVEELVSIFLATDVADIMKNFGKSTKQEDPVVHFYETFLAAYNPALRKARGVWYTPQPVVNFIVRAVDDILKTEFNLPQGLADTSKIKIKTKHSTKATADQRSKLKEVEQEQEVHRVQILDPATGTGTFLAEVVRHIYQKFKGQQGIWSNYVEQHLIPRLNGFELLMASYAMAHLKMDMLLTETGYKATTDQRFRIFLTNSLEEAHPDSGTLFSSWLSDEADQANAVKRDTPVMVIMGNPPYSGESANKGDWIMNLMEDYKKEPGGKEKLKERNPKWINDDYVKFLRYGQHFIEKNGSGVLAFINPHGFLDNPTFRGMRWNLLKTYDKIYTIDLHGNANKKEVSPDGTVDNNVFDIQQGVSINLFVKTGKKDLNKLGKVFHFDLYGKREFKYNFLADNELSKIGFNEIFCERPNYAISSLNFKEKAIYDIGFSLDEVFSYKSVGIVTSRDSLVVDMHRLKLEERMKDFFNNDISYCKNVLRVKENASFTLNVVKEKAHFESSYIKKISYRPFDSQYIYFDNTHFIERSRGVLINHFNEKNPSLVFRRQQPSSNDLYVFLSDLAIADGYIRSDNKGGETIAPLYLYPETNAQLSIGETQTRVPNLNMEIVNKIAAGLGMYFQAEKPDYNLQTEVTNQLYPIDILDYIYAVLHSPAYREKYKEFLKIDFPRVPYPTNIRTFLDLVDLGSQLRELHLLESAEVENYITQYPVGGDNVVDKIKFQVYDYDATPLGEEYPNYLGAVYINDAQYFSDVPMAAWEFYIGGYQPAQKWLKDRKGRELNFEDILHYQKMIVALTRTGELMLEIDRFLEV